MIRYPSHKEDCLDIPTYIFKSDETKYIAGACYLPNLLKYFNYIQIQRRRFLIEEDYQISNFN